MPKQVTQGASIRSDRFAKTTENTSLKMSSTTNGERFWCNEWVVRLLRVMVKALVAREKMRCHFCSKVSLDLAIELWAGCAAFR